MNAVLSEGSVRSIVALGAHPDDIEIGAGGLLMLLAGACPGLRVHYVLLTGTDERQAEARQAAESFLPGARISFALHTEPDGRLPGSWNRVKQHLHDAAACLQPDLVLCPSSNDAHQDHRLVGRLAPTVFRSARILSYEIPKWDGDLGRPNLYIPLSDEIARRKIALLDMCFPSQKCHDWWDEEVFLGLARLRGMECRSRYAEGFFSDKTVVSILEGDHHGR